jgi:hypothetical protein
MFFPDEDNFFSLLQQGKGDAEQILQVLKKYNCKINPEDEGIYHPVK